MIRLGYTQYVTQGGDWGYFITRVMGMSTLSHGFVVLMAKQQVCITPTIAAPHTSIFRLLAGPASGRP